MSFFDPHHVYDKKKRKSYKGQIIQKRLGTQLVPPMSREELARVEHYLLVNGLVTKDKKYSKTIHEVWKEERVSLTAQSSSIFHFGTMYNLLFKPFFEWKVTPVATQYPKSFEVMVAFTRIECILNNNLSSSVYTFDIQIPDRTNVIELYNGQIGANQAATFTPQDASFCQLQTKSGTSYINYTTVNNYSYLISYHSYDVNDYNCLQ